MSSYATDNSSVILRESDIPVTSNFEYTQRRKDPNINNYDVEYYVPDPTNDPLSSLIGKDLQTRRGVVEQFDGTYMHQNYPHAKFPVDGQHHYTATKQNYERN